MKVLLLRADNLRHRALSQHLLETNNLAAQIIEPKTSTEIYYENSLLNLHFQSRERSELDFFQHYSMLYKSKQVPELIIKPGQINHESTLEFISKADFDIAITFGVSILKNELIHSLNNSILGIHLGLSPYYRGSGTNFFPFVNRELACIGYTLMHLDSSIDGGAIIHQGRAPIVTGDSIHSIGNRNILQMFYDITQLIKVKDLFQKGFKINTAAGKLYRRKDFNLDSLQTAYQNLKLGLIDEYVEKKSSELKKFKIIENRNLRI